MNERIKECWLKAAREDSDPDNWDTQEQFIQRFAELIVRECAEIVEETRWMVPPSQEQIARSIKQHFGVK
jgi:hypothetical protein